MRKDYALLDQKIKAAYVEHLKRTKEIPTEAYIAKVCNTTQATVSKHLNGIDINDLVKPFKIFGSDVLLGLRNRAVKGDAQAAKLYFALIFDWSEKTEHKIEHKGELKVKYEKIPSELVRKVGIELAKEKEE